MFNPHDINHQAFMHRCIELAYIARERCDSPVGCVIVRDGRIMAEGIEGGRTHNDITFHAEIEAVRHAVAVSGNSDLSDCSLYTTHEPCIMCSYVIRHSRIKVVISGLPTGETGGYSSNFALLKDDTIGKWGKPPIVITGVLEEECKALYS